MTGPSLDPGFTTPAMAAVFDATARVAAMCRVEAALAGAQADAGLVPADVAAAIGRVCADGVDDADRVLRDGWAAGTPVLPLLAALRQRLPAEAASWLHHGATTQDVVDTGLVLQVRDGLDVLVEGLRAVARPLAGVAAAHRDTPALGRSFLQPAAPVTVGLRVAGWLEPALRHLSALRAARAGLVVQLGGPTGTLAALGDQAGPVAAQLAARLALQVPAMPWHADRSRVAELVALLQRVSRTMAKIGTDLALLAEAGEVRMRAGGSSSMPHKRNPIDAIRAIAAAEACSGAASVVTRGRPHELERGVGGWHAEWLAVPLTFHTCAAAVDGIRVAAETLEVDVEATAAALDRIGRSTAGPAAGAFVDRVLEHCDAVLEG